MTAPSSPPAAARASPRVRRTLLLIAVIGFAPIVASYATYHFWPREKQVNYGELVATKAPEIEGLRIDDGQPFRLSVLRGKWGIVFAASGTCDAACDRMLYATRQARAIQGSEQDRVVRVWLVSDTGTPAAEQVAQHPGLRVVRVAPDTLARLPGGVSRIYLIDPLGNLVLAWPADPDIKALANDLGRLLRASQIG